MTFKPISMKDSTAYISFHDPAVDKDRIIDAELEKNESIKNNAMLSDQEKREKAWEFFEFDLAFKLGKQPSKSIELLPIKDGETPTKFIIGAIPPDEVNRIHDETRETYIHRSKYDERYFRAFLHGIRKIENWPTEVKTKSIGEIEYVDPAWLKANFIRGLRKVAINVGQVVLAWQELTEDDIVNLS